MNTIKRYELATICVIAILVLSLFPVPEMPDLEDVPFIDKWTHMAMYAGLMLCVWFDWKRNKLQPKWGRSLIAMVSGAALGGIIELIQPLVHRSGEWMDFYADAVGAVLGCLMGYLAFRILTKVGKDNQ